VKNRTSAPDAQKSFDFTPPRPRPFVSNLPARIDGYEEGVAKYFQWRTGLDYYATTDQIVEFVIGTHRTKVIDCLTDTATFALRLAGRKAFAGRVVSFDSNVTLLERARQRAIHLNLHQIAEFRSCDELKLPVEDASAEIAVSIFDLHRQPAGQYLREAWRILAPDGHLILAEMVEPKSTRNRLAWMRKKMQLKYMHKNPAEAQGVYYDREEMIQLFFEAGFRQVIFQGLSSPKTRHSGVFTLVAATK
jgi:ubiquinone/menaquinone biosynthesis C-methylase UbiE